MTRISNSIHATIRDTAAQWALEAMLQKVSDVEWETVDVIAELEAARRARSAAIIGHHVVRGLAMLATMDESDFMWGSLYGSLEDQSVRSMAALILSSEYRKNYRRGWSAQDSGFGENDAVVRANDRDEPFDGGWFDGNADVEIGRPMFARPVMDALENGELTHYLTADRDDSIDYTRGNAVLYAVAYVAARKLGIAVALDHYMDASTVVTSNYGTIEHFTTGDATPIDVYSAYVQYGAWNTGRVMLVTSVGDRPLESVEFTTRETGFIVVMEDESGTAHYGHSRAHEEWSANETSRELNLAYVHATHGAAVRAASMFRKDRVYAQWEPRVMTTALTTAVRKA